MKRGAMDKEFTIKLSKGHYDALMIIISDAYPYADDRDFSPVFAEFIDEYLARESGRLGFVKNGEWKRK